MSDKPSYLKLLNAVSLAETNAHCYLTAWAETTTNPDVRRVVLTVAAREGEHGLAFAKRINELGFELMYKPDETLEQEARDRPFRLLGPGEDGGARRRPG